MVVEVEVVMEVEVVVEVEVEVVVEVEVEVVVEVEVEALDLLTTWSVRSSHPCNGPGGGSKRVPSPTNVIKQIKSQDLIKTHYQYLQIIQEGGCIICPDNLETS